jgi:hypothetical protein
MDYLAIVGEERMNIKPMKLTNRIRTVELDLSTGEAQVPYDLSTEGLKKQRDDLLKGCRAGLMAAQILQLADGLAPEPQTQNTIDYLQSTIAKVEATINQSQS